MTATDTQAVEWTAYANGYTRLWGNVIPWQRAALIEARRLANDLNDGTLRMADERAWAILEGKADRLMQRSTHAQVTTLARGLREWVAEDRAVAKLREGR